MILDYALNETVEIDGVQYIASQFMLLDSNLGVHPHLISKIDTDLKRIYFWVPKDGDLISDLYTTVLVPRTSLTESDSHCVTAFLPYSRIEIGLYNGGPSPSKIYKEELKRPINEELKQAYKETLIEKFERL